MEGIRNIKIGIKLIMLVAIAGVISIVLTVVGYIGLSRMNNMQQEMYDAVVVPTGYLMRFDLAYGNIRVLVRDFVYEQDSSQYANYERQISEYLTSAQKDIDAYNAYMKDFNVTSGEEYTQMSIINTNMPKLVSAVNNIVAAARQPNNRDAGMALIENELAPVTNAFSGAIDALIDLNIMQANQDNQQGSKQFDQSMRLSIISMVLGIAFLLTLAWFVIRTITVPIREMLAVANDLAKGNLNVNLRTGYKDETGQLAQAFSVLIDTLKRLTDDLTVLAQKHEAGDTDAVINDKTYEGAYQVLAQGLNGMLVSYVDGTFEILDCVNGFGQGDFKTAIRTFPGKKQRINTSIEALRQNLNAVSAEIRSMVTAGVEGRLSVRADASRYTGDWGDIINGLNAVLDAVVKPIAEASSVMNQLSKGDFSQKVEGDYKGDFILIKKSLNETVDNMSSYIKEISAVLTALANNNLNQVVTRDYVGEFAAIKDAMNMIIDKLNNVMEEINTASEQVNTGAKQISESSMTLAEGATEQASSIEELTATVAQVNEQTSRNADNAKKAESLAAKSRENAANGNAEMQNMLESMEGIKQASANISKIIQVIDDIALQTNLLALNAAVEAARAGQHGKGFAVVAEEVRSLAAKSKEAAQQTTSMIEDSINRVNQGTEIAKSTADALEGIVSDVTEVSQIISNISYASNEQSLAMSQMSEGVTQIAEVVQRNSATSEESAAAAEELSSQSEVLRNMIAIFNLRSQADKRRSRPSVQPTDSTPSRPTSVSRPVTAVRPAAPSLPSRTTPAPTPTPSTPAPASTPAPSAPASTPRSTAKKPASTSPARPQQNTKDTGDHFTQAKPSVGKQGVSAPSSAHVYESRDFGKY